MKKPKILLVQCEMHSWKAGRAWSYNLHIGWEEGFQENKVDFFTLTTPWIHQAKRILAGEKFDQVWINDLVLSSARDGGKITKDQLAFLANLAPIRVGLLTETIFDYSLEEMNELPDMQRTLSEVEKCLPYLTHVLAFDEADVSILQQRYKLPVLWSPSPVVGSLIYMNPPVPISNYALFSGSVYHGRKDWFENVQLQNYLRRMPSPDEGQSYPKTFNRLHGKLVLPFMRIAVSTPFYDDYIKKIRRIRRKSYELWLEGLQFGIGVVNLPHFVKTYTPRVIEGMAAGRPVLSWEIPDRPRNKSIFENGKEILLFNTPEELAMQVERLQKNPPFAKSIVQNAIQKILAFHTTGKRVEQILNWLETGEKPTYN